MTPWLPSPLNCLGKKGKTGLPKCSASLCACGHKFEDLQPEGFFLADERTVEAHSASLGHLHSEMHPLTLLQACQWHRHSLSFQPIFLSSTCIT